MSTGFSDDEEALYDQTTAGVLSRLRRTRNPADLLAVVRQVLEHRSPESMSNSSTCR